MRMIAWMACVAVVGGTCLGEEVALFNGRDLSGWVNVNGAAETWVVRDGMIVTSGIPKGFMRTERMYENYVLELEWRHVTEGGNAGVMVHADAIAAIGSYFPKSIEVQVKDGDHGSIFGILGATIRPLTNPLVKGWIRATPLEEHAKPAGEWNHYRLTSRDGTLELEVNGKLVTRADQATQVKGYICLEAEGAEAHFRNIRIRELASSNPPAEKIAMADEGFVSLFDGVSWRGWKWHEGLEGRWEIWRDYIRLRAEQGARERGKDDHLWTEGAYGDFVLVADWRLTMRPEVRPMNTFAEDGLFRRDAQGKVVRKEMKFWGDSGIYLRGEPRWQVNIWSQPMGSGDINDVHKDASLPEAIRRATMPRVNADNPPGRWNRFVITMKGDRVTVVLNGEVVIEDALLPGVPARGAIGLQNHHDPVEFRNLYIKELK